MASIVKRKSKYSVVYNIVDENGVKRQRWETFASQAEAKKRKAQIEYQQSTGTFIAPTAKTIRELLEEVDLLIDGPFILEKRDLTLLFRGSSNQRLILVKPTLQTGSITLMEEDV